MLVTKMRDRDPEITGRPEPSPPSPGKPSRQKPLLILVAAVIVFAAVVYLRPGHKPLPAAGAAALAAGRLVSIPVYYPQNLPAGYSYNNDAKTIKTNILYFSVSGPGKQTFYITQQPIPSNFDFSAFNKKFLSPDSFSTDAGSAIAGPIGASLVGSVQTDKNTWIIINSAGTNSQTELETVIRSLEPIQ